MDELNYGTLTISIWIEVRTSLTSEVSARMKKVTLHRQGCEKGEAQRFLDKFREENGAYLNARKVKGIWTQEVHLD